jgi:hypothetical protein
VSKTSQGAESVRAVGEEQEREHRRLVPSLQRVAFVWIEELLNRELAAKRVELAWTYGQTLTHTFLLPLVLRPLETLRLQAVEARVKVAGGALGLAIRFRAVAERLDGTGGRAAQ